MKIGELHILLNLIKLSKIIQFSNQITNFFSVSIDNIVTPIVCLSTAFFGVRFGPKKVSETLGILVGDE